MGTVKMVATKSYRYGGRPLVDGDEFEASAKDARTLRAIGRAKDVEKHEVTLRPVKHTEDADEDDEKPAKHVKRQYHRRDVQAEE